MRRGSRDNVSRVHTHCWAEEAGDSFRLNRLTVLCKQGNGETCPTGRTSFSLYKSMQERKQSQAYAQRDCHRHSRKPLSCKRWPVSFWGSLQSIATVEPDCKNSVEISREQKGKTWDTFFSLETGPHCVALPQELTSQWWNWKYEHPQTTWNNF